MKKRFLILMLIVLGLAFVFAACNMPAAEDTTSAKQTSVAQTVAAALPTNTPIPTNTPEGAAPSPTSETTTGETQPTATTSDTGSTTSGEDKAKFVSDVSIPDYSEYDAGEEITKTWRVQNVGTSTWSTDYQLVFMSGEKLGAADSIPIPFNVEPNAFLDISVDFTVPTAGGEYRSDWIFQNANGDEFGTGPEFDQSIYMIIVSNGDGSSSGSGTSGSSSIAGGANISNAKVTVDTDNYSGSCPATINFTYSVTTSEAGLVNYQLVFTTISPSGYSFDPPPVNNANFAGANTQSAPYTFITNSSVTATAKVVAVGANSFTSDTINFSVNCD